LKVLVTGAAGFLGSHLVDMLVERGDEVRALVLPGERVEHLQQLPSVEIVQGDLTDGESLRRAVQGVRRVYNLAARTGPWGLEKIYWQVNVYGLAKLVNVALEAGVERIVHTSSITVYGHFLRGVVSEEHPLHAEDNPYSRTKVAGEKLLAEAVRERGAPIVIVRPGWVYGPRDRASFGRFVALIESGKGFLIGSGQNVVPLVYVRDVAQGLIKAGEAGEQSIGQAYTIGDDRRTTQAAYFNAIAACLDVPSVTRRIPFWPLYTAARTAELTLGWRRNVPPPITTYGITLVGNNQEFSIEKARRELGYEPEYNLARGVAEGVNWYQEKKS
jgi:nucleoside-diphosphate-sugar epimerase